MNKYKAPEQSSPNEAKHPATSRRSPGHPGNTTNHPNSDQGNNRGRPGGEQVGGGSNSSHGHNN